MKFITISGIDKSGKTTLINAFNKRTNHSHYVIDRDPSNVMCLNEVQERGYAFTNPYRINYYKLIDKIVSISDLAIILECDIEDLKERFDNDNEPRLPGVLAMKEHQEFIINTFNKFGYKNVLKLNTSKLTVGDCVDKMLDAIGEK